MLILLTNNPAPQASDVEPLSSTINKKVEAEEVPNPTLAEFEVENSSLLNKICKLIPIGSMTSNLPMIPLL
ncbi:MAG: hypothetical protein QNJ70_26575 [Xenococcaceae cyanobacterium MO_207.B15]|nr:hypothetical protein [Xenococcaceae cyanobacterium MO_207.B15]